MGYQGLLVDIINNCNLRCPFCYNDWTKPVKTKLMDSDTFDKVIELLPLVDRGFMACNFESTLHPDYLDYFERLPEGKPYTFITTNLAKKFTDREFERLANTNLDSVTISVDSFKKEVYESLRKGADFDVFLDNLKRISKIFKGKKDLRFITIAFKQNQDEIEDIIKTTRGYGSVFNQVRTVFKHTFRDDNSKWLKKSIITKTKWKQLKKLSTPVVSFFNPLYEEYAGGRPFIKIDPYGKVEYDGKIIDIDKAYKYFKEAV